jgi:hypothetical protein
MNISRNWLARGASVTILGAALAGSITSHAQGLVREHPALSAVSPAASVAEPDPNVRTEVTPSGVLRLLSNEASQDAMPAPPETSVVAGAGGALVRVALNEDSAAQRSAASVSTAAQTPSAGVRRAANGAQYLALPGQDLPAVQQPEGIEERIVDIPLGPNGQPLMPASPAPNTRYRVAGGAAGP